MFLPGWQAFQPALEKPGSRSFVPPKRPDLCAVHGAAERIKHFDITIVHFDVFLSIWVWLELAFYVLFTLLRPFFSFFPFQRKCQAFFTHFLRTFYAFYALSLFSFPMKVSSFFYTFFTYFLRFLRPFFSFFPFKWKCQAFFTHFLRTFYAFYAFSSLFSFPMKMSSFFYAFFTYFLRFLRPFFSFFLSNESVKPFLRIFYVLFTLFTPFLILCRCDICGCDTGAEPKRGKSSQMWHLRRDGSQKTVAPL